MLSMPRMAVLLFGLSLPASFAGEDATGFPARPIQVIVPFSAGGGSDTFARIIQQAIREHNLLPHPFVIQNVPGAGGTIGSRRALHAEPNGHTILFLHEGILTAKVSGQATWGPEDFEPIAATGEVGAIIAVAEDSSYSTLKELLAAAAVTPNEVTFGSNVGAPSHFWALLLENAEPGAQFRYVQSGGGATRFAALKGGHVSASAFSVAEYLAFREGGIRALAFLGEERHPALPDIPTAKDNGLEVLAGNIQCWWAPKGTNPGKIDIIARALEQAMQTPTVRQRLDEMQIDPVFLTGEAFDTEISKRRAAVSAVAHRAIEGLPDLPLFLMIATALTGAWLLVARLRSDRIDAAREPSSIDRSAGHWQAITVILLTLCLAIAFQFGRGNTLVIAGGIFMVILGACLMPKPISAMRFGAYVVFSVAFLLLVDVVFKNFFSIDLP